jgi:hypothetical protein
MLCWLHGLVKRESVFVCFHIKYLLRLFIEVVGSVTKRHPDGSKTAKALLTFHPWRRDSTSQQAAFDQ